MISGKTTTGFDYTIDERKVRSWSLVKRIAEIQKSDMDLEIYAGVMDIVDILIGKEQEAKLIQHVTNVYGYDDAEMVTKEIFEMIGAAKLESTEIKNSSSSPDVSQPTREPLSVISQKPMESINTIPYQSNMPQSFAQG